jgi:hypothetical protein
MASATYPSRTRRWGHHLNFRDPDGIALAFDAPTDLAMKAQRVLASGQMTPEEIAAFVAEHFGPDTSQAAMAAAKSAEVRGGFFRFPVWCWSLARVTMRSINLVREFRGPKASGIEVVPWRR